MERDFEELGASSPTVLIMDYFSTNVHEYSNGITSLYLKPEEKALVQGDTFSSNSIYLKQSIGMARTVKVYWHLLSRDFEDTGVVDMEISPKYFNVMENIDMKTVEEEKIEQFISYVQRRPSNHMLFGSSWDDNKSNYNFEYPELADVNFEVAVSAVFYFA